MKVTTNDVIVRHNYITNVLFVNKDDALSKNLKIKIMAMRIEYSNIVKAFDADVNQFTESILDDKFKKLRDKENKSAKDIEEFNKMVVDYNSQINTYAEKRSKEKVEIHNEYLTEEEFNEILIVNIENNVKINNNEYDAPTFLENLHSIFVK